MWQLLAQNHEITTHHAGAARSFDFGLSLLWMWDGVRAWEKGEGRKGGMCQELVQSRKHGRDRYQIVLLS